MMNKAQKNQTGFTLVELLVVIAIIGILGSVVLVGVSRAKEKARLALVAREMQQITRLIQIARDESNQTTYAITGTDCSDCDCRASHYHLPSLASDHSCIEESTAAFEAIVAATDGVFADAEGLYTDPWGSPYLIDENENARWWCPCDRYDFLRSVGPDGVYDGEDDEDIVDDIKIELPLFACTEIDDSCLPG